MTNTVPHLHLFLGSRNAFPNATNCINSSSYALRIVGIEEVVMVCAGLLVTDKRCCNLGDDKYIYIVLALCGGAAERDHGQSLQWSFIILILAMTYQTLTPRHNTKLLQ